MQRLCRQETALPSRAPCTCSMCMCWTNAPNCRIMIGATSESSHSALHCGKAGPTQDRGQNINVAFGIRPINHAPCATCAPIRERVVNCTIITDRTRSAFGCGQHRRRTSHTFCRRHPPAISLVAMRGMRVCGQLVVSINTHSPI